MSPPAPTDAAKPITEAPHHQVPAHLYWFTKLIQMPLMALATAFFGTISLICGLWDRSGRRQHLVARAWAGVMLRCALSPVQLIHPENLPRRNGAETDNDAVIPSEAASRPSRGTSAFASSSSLQESAGAPFIERSEMGGKEPLPGEDWGVAVYASNHLSYMDTPVLFARLPFQFRILAKQGLWKVPFVGWYLARSGQVPIDSSSPRSAVAGLLRGVAALRSGMSIVVFPEGSRSPSGALNPMASGAAFMAIRAQVPLVPVALIGTYQLLPIHVYALRPRPLKIVVGQPIPTAGLTTKDAETLTAQLYAEIEHLYYTHSEPERNR